VQILFVDNLIDLFEFLFHLLVLILSRTLRKIVIV